MNKIPCDILIRNGQVVTMDAARTIYSPGAVAITGSRILRSALTRIYGSAIMRGRQ